MAKDTTAAAEFAKCANELESGRGFNYKEGVVYKLGRFEGGKLTKDALDAKTGKKIKQVLLKWGENERVIDARNLLPFGLDINGDPVKNKCLGKDVDSMAEISDVVTDTDGFSVKFTIKVDGFGSALKEKEDNCIVWGSKFYKRRTDAVQLVNLIIATPVATEGN